MSFTPQPDVATQYLLLATPSLGGQEGIFGENIYSEGILRAGGHRVVSGGESWAASACSSSASPPSFTGASPRPPVFPSHSRWPHHHISCSAEKELVSRDGLMRDAKPICLLSSSSLPWSPRKLPCWAPGLPCQGACDRWWWASGECPCPRFSFSSLFFAPLLLPSAATPTWKPHRFWNLTTWQYFQRNNMRMILILKNMDSVEVGADAHMVPQRLFLCRANPIWPPCYLTHQSHLCSTFGHKVEPGIQYYLRVSL